MKLALIFLYALGTFYVASPKAHAQQVDKVGGCFIAHLRATQKPISPRVAQGCGATPNSIIAGGKTFQEIYAWAMPFLINGFDNAERAHCGLPGCATGNSHVQIVLFADGAINLLINRASPNEITVAISTGMIDFVEGTILMMFQDFKDDPIDMAAENGLRKWLEGLSSFSQSQCRLRYPSPKLTVDTKQNYSEIRVFAAGVYAFLFAHELAHIQYGPTCGSQSRDPLAIEIACDKIAFSKLAEYGIAAPVPIMALLASIHRYERLAGPILAPPRMGLETAFPARNWTARGQSISRSWSQFCAKGEKPPTCIPKWEIAKDYADELLDIELPEQCEK